MNRILIVDDDFSIVEALRIVLEEGGYTVDSITDGFKIYDAISENSPELILLDYWLSGIDGGTITKQLKSQLDTKTIPIIVISANYASEKTVRAAGVDGFLAKPFNIFELLTMIEYLIVKNKLL